jgi:cell division protein FtsQ
VAVAGGAAGSTRTPLLDVDRISVVGASRTGTKAVAEATGVAIGDPMTDVNSGAVVARVETLPWVERASVQRLWPATLRIRVAERTPAAQILAGNRVILIDESGRLLASRPEPAPGLVAIEGLRGGAPGERIPAARPVLEVVAALPAALATEVTAARPVPGGLELVLDRDIVVRFGPAAAIEEKLDALAAVLAGADLSDAAVIDVRVPRAPVTLTGGPGGA